MFVEIRVRCKNMIRSEGGHIACLCPPLVNATLYSLGYTAFICPVVVFTCE